MDTKLLVWGSCTHITQYDTQLGVLICTSISLVLSQNRSVLKILLMKRSLYSLLSKGASCVHKVSHVQLCVISCCIRNTSTVIAAEFCAQAEFMLPN